MLSQALLPSEAKGLAQILRFAQNDACVKVILSAGRELAGSI